MHGFNKFEIDTFAFPELCSRCAEHEATATWQLVHSTIEFPDGPPTGLGNERRNYNDYVTKVPVCDKCHSTLKRGSRLCWLLGAVGGAVAAFYTMRYMVAAEIKLQGCILAAVAAAAVVTLLVGWVLKLIVTDGFGFAKLDGLNSRLTFKNKKYQEIFERLNPQCWKPGAAAVPSAEAAKGW